PGVSAADTPAPRPARMIPASGLLDELALDEDERPGTAPAAHLPNRPAPAGPIAPAAGRWWRAFTPSWSWPWAAWLAGALAVLSSPLAGWIAVRRLSRAAQPIDETGWSDLARELSIRIGLSRRGAPLRGDSARMATTL